MTMTNSKDEDKVNDRDTYKDFADVFDHLIQVHSSYETLTMTNPKDKDSDRQFKDLKEVFDPLI